MPSLSSKEIRQLRTQSAQLTAITVIGKRGITPEVDKLIKASLQKNNLIKVTVRPNAFDDRKAEAVKMAERYNAVLVRQIGGSIILYRIPEED